MNKPATKEPSMDEILSSIRQIIADDDAASAVVAAPPPIPRAAPKDAPLALSPAQIVQQTPPKPMASAFEAEEDDEDESAFDPPRDEAELLDPEDIAFEGEPEPVTPPPPPAPPRMAEPPRRVEPTPPPPRPAMSVSQAAPMPDPNLSRDMAEQLLAPAAEAAASSAMGRLSSVMAVGNGQTVEAMMRDLLRPMLKEWLDENLPSVVERMVEKEIARISRGAR